MGLPRGGEKRQFGEAQRRKQRSKWSRLCLLECFGRSLVVVGALLYISVTVLQQYSGYYEDSANNRQSQQKRSQPAAVAKPLLTGKACATTRKEAKERTRLTTWSSKLEFMQTRWECNIGKLVAGHLSHPVPDFFSLQTWKTASAFIQGACSPTWA